MHSISFNIPSNIRLSNEQLNIVDESLIPLIISYYMQYEKLLSTQAETRLNMTIDSMLPQLKHITDISESISNKLSNPLQTIPDDRLNRIEMRLDQPLTTTVNPELVSLLTATNELARRHDTMLTDIKTSLNTNKTKGNIGEARLFNLLTGMYACTNIKVIDTSQKGNAGDIQVVLPNNQTIIVESKYYSTNSSVSRKDLEAYKNVIMTNSNVKAGIIICFNGGIVDKSNSLSYDYDNGKYIFYLPRVDQDNTHLLTSVISMIICLVNTDNKTTDITIKREDIKLQQLIDAHTQLVTQKDVTTAELTQLRQLTNNISNRLDNIFFAVDCTLREIINRFNDVMTMRTNEETMDIIYDKPTHVKTVLLALMNLGTLIATSLNNFKLLINDQIMAMIDTNGNVKVVCSNDQFTLTNPIHVDNYVTCVTNMILMNKPLPNISVVEFINDNYVTTTNQSDYVLVDDIITLWHEHNDGTLTAAMLRSELKNYKSKSTILKLNKPHIQKLKRLLS